MRAHVVALGSGTDGPAATTLALGALQAAADDGAHLVVLPEYASRFDPRGVGREHAEPLDEGFVPALQGVAGARGIAVIAGTTVPAGERAANVVVGIDATGRLVGTYRKVHLYDAFGMRESDRLEAGPAGAEPLLLEVGGLVVGVLTCYDLRFPESARRLVDAGATALAVPAAWAAGEHKADHWLTLLRARAIENTCYVLGAAQQGTGVTGESVVVDPDGLVLARTAPPAADQERAGTPSDAPPPAAAVADLSPAVVAATRTRNPSLANRRYAVVPAGTSGVVPAGGPGVVPAGTPSVVPAGTPSVVPAGTSGVVPAGGPGVVPAGAAPVDRAPAPAPVGRALWDRWLGVAWVLALLLGLALVVAAAPMVAVFDTLFFGPGAAPVDTGAGRDYLAFVHQVLGAVLVGWALLLAGVAAGPLRRRERWAWWAAAVSVGTWYALDSVYSLVAGFGANALLNSALAACFAVPLVAMWRELAPRGARVQPAE